MSIQSEIERIQNNVDNTYSALSDLGATMPETRNSSNLSSTAASVAAVLYSEQQLTDEQKAQARENIGANAGLSYVDISSKTAILEPNTIYDFGTLSTNDIIDITFNKPANATGAELWHAIFIAGSTQHDIQLNTSDNSSIKVYAPYSYVIGEAYEISMLDNIVHIMGIRDNVSESDCKLSFVTVTSNTAILEPNTIYDFGILDTNNTLNITFNKPANATGAELWHAKFIPSATQHDIQLNTSDGSSIKVYGPNLYVIGETYEISMLDNVVHIIGIGNTPSESDNSLSFVIVTSKTVTLEPNTIYDFGTLNADDVINITFNKPINATGAELWHAIFIASATHHDIQVSTSDSSSLKVYGPEEFKPGVTYEMSMLNNVIFIG